MIRRLLGVSAIVLTAGLAVAGCAPVRMGAAAIVGDQRVTVANLDTQAGQLAVAAKQYPNLVQLTQQQITQTTLSWLIQFQIFDQLARDEGIAVSTAQQQNAFNTFFSNEDQQAKASGVANLTPAGLLAHFGISPDLQPEFSRYLAIETEYVTMANGGTLPSTQEAQSAANAKLSHASCLAARSLNIKVNPQFGRLDYTNFTVVNAPDTVSRVSGPVSASAPEGLTPAC